MQAVVHTASIPECSSTRMIYPLLLLFGQPDLLSDSTDRGEAMSDNYFHWTRADMPSQVGRRIIVTGASSGLGAIAARELAGAGAHVILAVRDLEKGDRVATGIRAGSPGAVCRVEHLDLAELSSVRSFADRMLAAGEPLDVLLLNAGVSNQPYSFTGDGIEKTFATNVVGHFALTNLLLPLLEMGGDPRVVSVGSNLYRRFRADLAFDDLAFGDYYSPQGSYVRSKVATVLFAAELERRLRSVESPVRSLIAHPGMSTTPMHDNVTGFFQKSVMGLAHALISRDAEEGALPLLFAATSEQAPSMRFLGWHTRRSDKRLWSDEFVGLGADEDLARTLWKTLDSVTAEDLGVFERDSA
ncbi:short-chain dehydrogenase [Williamsia sp. 1138]|nr:short-chain dehydrogenase [Williamsia sp. 1138]